MAAVANFTPDEIRWHHLGATGLLAPGSVTEFETHRANHIVNKFGPRGIVTLVYGDDQEVKAKEAMATWKRFWIKQITVYNQDNEKRKNTNREYVDPTEILLEHSKTIGIPLVGPWMVKETSDDVAVQALKNENAELRVAVLRLTETMTAIQADLSKRAEGTPEAIKTTQEKLADAAELKKEYARLTKETFANWVIDNLDNIQNKWPEDAVKDMAQKWTKLYNDPWPIPK